MELEKFYWNKCDVLQFNRLRIQTSLGKKSAVLVKIRRHGGRVL